jgi:hypothetical protein
MHCSAVADPSHLQSLAAAAAAAAPGSVLLSVPGPLLGGALQEVEQHRLGLVAFGEQVQQLARDAAAAQQQLAASLQDSEGDLAAAMQVREREIESGCGLLAGLRGGVVLRTTLCSGVLQPWLC